MSRLALKLLVIVNLLIPAAAPAQAAPPQQLAAIVVMDFEGYGLSDTEALVLSDRLRSELFQLGLFRIVERGLMATILKEQDFESLGCATDECMIEIGQLLGADQIVGGSVSKLGKTFTISARLVDIESGKVMRVSDYDHQGEMDDLLTEAIPVIAKQLSTASPARVRIDNTPEVDGIGNHRWTISVGGGSKESAGRTVYDQGAVILSFFRNKPLSIGSRIFPVAYTLIVGGGTWYEEEDNYVENFGALLIGTVNSLKWNSLTLEGSVAAGPGAVYSTRESGLAGSEPTIETDVGISLFYTVGLQIAYKALPIVAELRYTNDVRFQQQVVGLGAGYRW